jgi:hypothetical protein
MIRVLLSLLGLHIVYVCDWGTYKFRYDSIDVTMNRPIHPGMSVAPPWARMKACRLAAS